MPSIESMERLRAALDSPGGVFGPFMTTADPAFVEAAGYAGYDVVLLDVEHGSGSCENLQDLIRAAEAAHVVPVVRIPWDGGIRIGQVLDMGAGGLLIPRIDTVERARAAVSAMKDCEGRPAGGPLSGKACGPKEREPVVILQAEGSKALEKLDEILAVEGIDVLFVSPYHLSSALGLTGQLDHPKVTTSMQGIIERAAEKGVRVGCYADNVATAKKLRNMGVKFIGYSCDTAIFRNAAAADVEAFQRID